MDESLLSTREYEFNNYSLEPLSLLEDPTGILHAGVGSTIWDAGIVLAKFFEKSNILGHAVSSEGTQDQPKSLNVLELGSGTGLVGLAVARFMASKGLGGRVVVTDKESVLPLLRKNTERNKVEGVNIEARVLDWEHVSGIFAPPSGDTTASQAAEKDANTPPNQTSTRDHQDPAPLETTQSEKSSSTVHDSSDLLSIEWDLVIVSDCIWFPALYPSLVGTLDKLIPSTKTRLVVSFEKRDFSQELEFFAQLGKVFRFRDVKPEEQDPTWQSEDIYLFSCGRRD
ncbi:Methyltransferase-like protein 21D [Lunasporangiospora selenospora]|uniref:Methyltransferase-like protein 21D n=1 Tax=Lunasporangiospora selenospora TaxID=979761 RepID=A0A9P6FTF5_9FUNG|nr:Methyltransferase-like protein 21D [Lunasporangiospora selenospora]